MAKLVFSAALRCTIDPVFSVFFSPPPEAPILKAQVTFFCCLQRKCSRDALELIGLYWPKAELRLAFLAAAE